MIVVWTALGTLGGLTFVLAVASYYLIEMPVLRWRAKAASRRKGTLRQSAPA